MNHRKVRPPCPVCGGTDAKNVKRITRGEDGVKIIKLKCRNPKCGRQYTAVDNETDQEQGKTTYDESGDKASLGGNIRTKAGNRAKILSEFMAQGKVDMDIWEVNRYLLNAWDVTMSGDKSHTDSDTTYTNYQIKVWLKKKVVPIVELAYEHFVKDIPKFRFTRPPIFVVPSGVALEVSVFDAHIGKLAWENEIGRRSYDLKQAVSDYEYAVDQILGWSMPFKPEQIFYVVGQDLLHTDNFKATTPHGGFQLDADGRLPKIFAMAFEAVLKGIYKARAVAPVNVIWIPGNHDEHTSLFLCFALKQHFRDDPHVTVDISEQPRKVRIWGSLLVGWTHEIAGRLESWGNELAQAFPKEWAESKFREWHYGHKHRKKEVKMTPLFTSGGVVCRRLTALSEIDKWHYDNLYTDAVSGGEGFLWSKDKGIFSNFTAWTPGRMG